jgi:hypothetical protein
MSRYPRIGDKRQLRKVPLCKVCGDVATWQIAVQTGWTRGDDEIVYVCNLHQLAEATDLLRGEQPYAKPLGPKKAGLHGEVPA